MSNIILIWRLNNQYIIYKVISYDTYLYVCHVRFINQTKRKAFITL